jgi:hypothetical protein
MYTSGTNTLTSPSISVSTANESAVCATNSGTSVTITTPTITSSAAGSNADDASFYGMDAAILAYGTSATTGGGATITVSDGTITTTGKEGNGVFASMGGTVTISGTTINASADGAHGLDAAYAGTLNITNVTATTAGQSSSVVATDRGGGTVTVKGGSYTASGYRSAGIYSTGVVKVTGGSYTANNAEAVVVEGANAVTINGTDATYGSTKLVSKLGEYRGIFLYQSTSGDAETGTSSFTMTDGSISYTCDATTTSSCTSGSTSSGANNPATLFSVANTTAEITLTDVTVTNSTPTSSNSYGTLLTAQALNSGTWGTAGSNGGKVTFTAKGMTLVGNVIVDANSTAALVIKKDSSSTGSTLTGAINNANSGSAKLSLTLDSASKWTVTGTSYLTALAGLTISGSTVSNIDGGGHCVYYSGTINGSSSSTTYTLGGTSGGTLAPSGTTGLTCN